MVSFYQLWEQMELNTPLMDSGEDTKAVQVIRAGNNLHKEDQRPFWDEFMELCSNSEGMADLLNVDSSTVLNWTSKIRNLLEKVQDDKTQDADEEEKRVLPTGDNGALTFPNADPDLSEL